MSVPTKFHHQVKIFLIMEKSIKLHNVRVIQIHLNFYLSYQRFFNILLLDFCFRYGFDGAYKICRLVPSHEYLTIFALTQLFQHFEIIYAKRFGRERLSRPFILLKFLAEIYRIVLRGFDYRLAALVLLIEG